jgi:succinate dehydrogenase/fumarate reductase flavoprotein subunit/uncharacterized protein with FMN-binding domain
MKRIFRLALIAIATIALALGCVSSEKTPASFHGLTYADTIAWDGEYDVIVVGFGGAGATAATHAARAGASVLLTEKAPEGNEGGNTRYCGQLVATAENYADGLAYYKQLAGSHTQPEAVMDVFIRGIVDMKNILREEYGANIVYSGKKNPWVANLAPEYPEFTGSKAIDLVSITPEISNGALWNAIRKNVMDMSDKIDVWFEAPGKQLIQDPVSKTIIGVRIEKQGKLVAVRARNGVVLATGGFENNPEMRQYYLGLPRMAVLGSLYNTGDGVKMAMEAGADLWHMEAWEGVASFGGSSFVVNEDEHASAFYLPNGSLLLVDNAGNRFIREDENTRHGHIYMNGFFHHPVFPEKYYLIYDQAQKGTIDKAGAIPARFQNQVVSAPSLEVLARQLKLPNLVTTVTNFNNFTRNGADLELGRSVDTMAPLTNAPYYALELMPLMLNTQGGPRRDEKAQILDTKGNPIPNLYSAGELGGITTNLYQGGGNMAECIIYGRIAGTNAAQPKAPLPQLQFRRVSSNLVYTPGRGPGADQTVSYATTSNEYTGVGSGGMGGDITVKVTMEGTKIAAIEVLGHNETPGICDEAIARLPGLMVSSQTANVDGVSGATLTSNALKAAVKDALLKVK